MAIKLDYAIQESLTNIRRNFFMTLAAVLVVAVALFLFGSVFLLRNAVSRTVDLFTGQVRVSVFLDPEIDPALQQELQQEIQTLPEVRSVRYESKQQAYENFKRLFQSQPAIVRNTTPDALPASFRVQLDNPEEFEVIRDRFDGRPGIANIRDEAETVRQLFRETRTLRTGALAMAIVVGVAAVVLIATTIRMALYARRKEIGIMKLVGATNWFIRIPFMMEGVVQGAVGAFAAVLLLIPTRGFITNLGAANISFNLRPEITFVDVAVHGVYLLLAGMVVGAVGSVFGLRRFLDV